MPAMAGVERPERFDGLEVGMTSSGVRVGEVEGCDVVGESVRGEANSVLVIVVGFGGRTVRVLVTETVV